MARKPRTPSSKAPAAEKKVTAPKVIAAKATPAEAKAPKAPKVHAHVEAGVDTSRYSGPSAFLNGNRKTRVRVVPAKAVSEMSDRMKAALYAMRETYGNRTFPAKGIDNGVLRDLRAAGLVELNGTEVQEDGNPYIVDGANPATVKITPVGAAFGKA